MSPTASSAPPISTAGGEANNPDWKVVAFDETSGAIVAPRGTIGFRWGESGKWNLDETDLSGKPIELRLSLADIKDEFADVAFPYFGNIEHAHFARPATPASSSAAYQ